MFILPAFIGFFMFTFFPILFSLVISFCDWDLVSGISGIRFVGLDNFVQMFQNPIFYKCLVNNFIFLLNVPATIAVALILAVVLNSKVFIPKVLRLVFFLPYVADLVASTVVWMAMYYPAGGPINSILRTIGIQNPPGWIADPDWALIAIIIFNVWHTIGYAMIIYLAAIQEIPNELYEACTIDGAGSFKKFTKITVPMLSKTTFFLLVTRTIISFQVFTPVKIFTEGGPANSTNVIVYEVYKQAFMFYKMGNASALAWILFIIIFVVTLLQWRYQEKNEY